MEVNPNTVVDALLGDTQLDFQTNTGKTLRKGICPECNKRELYISTLNPWQLNCPRDNKCGYTESTRSRYPDLWEDLSKRVPATETDPNATARAFLSNRGFNISKLEGQYKQEIRKIKIDEGDYINADVVRFPLWDDHYWDRLINESEIIKVGEKARVSWGITYIDKGWVSPKFNLAKDDRCFITEGIFDSIAFIENGEQSIAGISSSSFPWDILKEHEDKNITWVLAYDDDSAGHKAIRKFTKMLATKGYKYRIALTGSSKDWNDFHKDKKLTPEFIERCIWRGDVFNAKTVGEKAYYHYQAKSKNRFIIDFNHRLYQINVDGKLSEALIELWETTNQIDIEDTDREMSAAETSEVFASKDGRELFNKHVKTFSISSCLPTFLYGELDKLTGDIAYYFEITSPREPAMQVALSGSSIESPGSLNKALLNRAFGARFSGDASQLQQVHDRWFANGIPRVETVPFIGYDKASGIYVYPKFAYHQGRALKLNNHNYFEAGKSRIKTNFKSFDVVEGDRFTPDWIIDFHKTFHWNGLVTLAFWLGSFLAEQIRARNSSYPFLEMSGIPGTGKSTVLEFLWKCTGRDDYEGFDPSKATFVGRAREFIQAANMPVALIEGDRGDKDAKKGGFDYNETKTAYNGRSVRTMAAFNRGNDTESPPFRGAFLFAQNAEIDAEEAVLERIVNLEYTKAHFSPETKQLSEKLERMSVRELAGFLPAVLEREQQLLTAFDEHYKHLVNRFTDNRKMKNQRVIKNHAQMAALGFCLNQLFPYMTTERCERLAEFIELRGVERETRLRKDHPLVIEFWESYDILENGGVRHADNTRVNHSLNPNIIAINLPHFKQMCTDNSLEMSKQGELTKLLRSCTSHKFIKQGPVESGLWGRTSKCWLFENLG